MQNSSELFRDYYAQFVNEDIKARIMATIGLSLLLASKDEHLNDISMQKWDKMAGFAFRGSEMVSSPKVPSDIWPVDYELVKEAGDGISAAFMVCVYKEAARQIIEAHNITNSTA